MKGKRLAASAAAIVMAVSALCSCGSHINSNEKIGDTTSAVTKETSAVTELGSGSFDDRERDTDSSPDRSDLPPIEEEPAPVIFDQTNFDQISVPYIEYSKTYQAESGSFLADTAVVLKDRASFKGDGYVSGASAENWCLTFDLPVSQFYNITVMTASDRALNSTLSVNGRDVWVFRTEGTGSFAEKQLVNIWLEEGINEIRLSSTDNAVDIDYIKIESNKEISMLSPDLSASTLSNANATWRAEALYQVLCSNFGKEILTAQHDIPGDLAGTDLVNSVTHKYPAIRISDIGGYTKGNPKDVSKAMEYWNKGGIVGYDWYWIDPAGEKSSIDYEIANVNFDIRKAVPKTVEVQVTEDPVQEETEDGAVADVTPAVRTEKRLEFTTDEMSMWSEDQIESRHENGDITDECYYILKDIDKVSAKLTKLFDENIPVLWRPLPVASNGLYWWGLDKDSYKWLWELMYKRMTAYHGLNNLVWVWSAQNVNWYVGDEYCDVLSVDIYSDGNRDAQINTMLFLNNISSKKPLAISECGALPAMESILREKALWSYTALYTEPYLGNELGMTVERTDARDALQARFTEYYNNNYTLTMDELPSIADVAKAIRDKAKKDGRAKTKSKVKGKDLVAEQEEGSYDENAGYSDDNGSGEDQSGDGSWNGDYSGDYNYDYSYDYNYDYGYGY